MFKFKLQQYQQSVDKRDYNPCRSDKKTTRIVWSSMETSTSRNRYCSIKMRLHLLTTGKDSRDLTEHVCEEIEHIPSSLSRHQRQTAHRCKPVLHTYSSKIIYLMFSKIYTRIYLGYSRFPTIQIKSTVMTFLTNITPGGTHFRRFLPKLCINCRHIQLCHYSYAKVIWHTLQAS